MRNGSLLLLTGLFVVVAASAEAGCGSKDTTPTPALTSGAGAGSTGSMTTGPGSTTTGTSTGGASTTGSASTGTGGGSSLDCTTYATSYCAAYKKCEGNGLFTYLFENETICEAVTKAACMGPEAPNVVDPAGCTAALSTSCGVFSGTNIPAACKTKPGNLMNNATCDPLAPQCAANFYCYPAMDTTCAYCTPSSMVGDPCQGTNGDQDSLCDNSQGQHCVKKFDATMGATADDSTCEIVAYGQAGAMCFPDTEKSCDVGFVCSAPANKGGTCVAALAINTPCQPTLDICDHSQGLTCQTANGTSTCTPPAYVNIGAQCTPVMGVPQNCSYYAVCGKSGMCEAKVMKDAPCTTSPDNCYPGLSCQSATCQPMPAGPACMPMTQ